MEQPDDRAGPVTKRPAPPPGPSFLDGLRASPVTVLLMAINVVVFALAEHAGSTLDEGTLLRFGASEQVHVRAGEYWRLLTPMFLHVGLAHLAVNSYFGFGWCAAIERELGKARFLFIYLVSGIAGGAASVAGHQAVSAGASGAVFGVIGATLILRRRMLPSWRAAVDDPPTRSVLINIAILVVIGFTVVNMDHFAHLGGAVAGGALAWLLTAAKPSPGGWAAAGIGFVALLLVAIWPGWPSRKQAPLLTEWAGVYYHGEPFGRDDERAVKFSRRACAAGDPAACGLLGALQYQGRGTPLDREGGLALMMDACQRGSEWACSVVQSETPGKGVPQR